MTVDELIKELQAVDGKLTVRIATGVRVIRAPDDRVDCWEFEPTIYDIEVDVDDPPGDTPTVRILAILDDIEN